MAVKRFRFVYGRARQGIGKLTLRFNSSGGEKLKDFLLLRGENIQPNKYLIRLKIRSIKKIEGYLV
jgi:hypothetical protein